MRKFLSYISILIIFLGMSGFMFNTLLIPSSVITFQNELPISDIQGIIEKMVEFMLDWVNTIEFKSTI